MKQTIKFLINKFVYFLLKFKFFNHFSEVIINLKFKKNKKIIHNGENLIFCTPNRLCEWRVDTFSTKEPETLSWINKFEQNTIFWDIGANIGLYSIYAAKISKSKVFAFEPSVFNLEILARNVYLNKLSSTISIIPLPLNDLISFSNMKLTSTEWGGALSTFDKNFGWNGKNINQIFEYNILGVTMNDAHNLFKVPYPDYIKIDVDGLEHYILNGGKDVIKNCKEILIEINDDFYDQANECEEILKNLNFELSEKKNSELISKTNNGFQNSFNQIWKKII
jgi:FkbM family methyltransferase